MALPKIEAWQYEAMVDWLKNGEDAWRILACPIPYSPQNTALHVHDAYEKFKSHINNLEPPEGGSLVMFPTWQMVRRRMYSWKRWVKNQIEKLRITGQSGRRPPTPMEKTDKILYDLLRGSRMPAA